MTPTQQPQATSNKAKAAAARARSTAAKKSSSNNGNNNKQQNNGNTKKKNDDKKKGGKNNTTHKASTKVPAVPIAVDGKQKRANRKSYRRAKQLEVSFHVHMICACMQYFLCI